MARAVRIGENARRGLAGPRRRVVDAAGFSVGAVLAGVAALRRGKAVHPHGAVYEAQLVVPRHAGDLGRTELFGTPGSRPAVVRFSRSLGLPRPLPDLLGMSLRVLDAYGSGRHQDFLMVSSVDAPVLHHLFVPASDVQQRPYSSSLRYRAGDRSFLVGAVPRAGELVFDLAVAEVWGRFRPVAEVRVGDPLPPEADALLFNPWNSGGGLDPTGFLNRLRDIAYPMSQRAWARAGRAGDQAAASTAVGTSRYSTKNSAQTRM